MKRIKGLGLEQYQRMWILVIFGLVGFTTFSAIVLSSSSVTKYAYAEYMDSLSVTVPSSCSMSGLISSGNEHNVTMNSGDYETNIGETTISVTCNDSAGYSIYTLGYGNDTDGVTTLKGATTNLTIPTGTVTDTSVSNWAMKLTAVTGTFTPTILSDTNGSFASYHIVPASATKAVTFTGITNLSTTSQFKTTYAVAISNAY